jgi:glucose/arabinose dehydrogenase
MTKIIRARLRDHRLVDIEPIFEIPKEKYQKGYVLFGGRMVFRGDYLFFSVGERGVLGDAQRLELPNGKIHRVFSDGRIPPDNPFVDVPGAVGSIWSYGHRNPQGLALSSNGELWETEHGPRGGDELNRIERGRNYGWPLITYGINYDGTPVTNKTEDLNLEQPVRHWTPSIATSQIGFYSGERFSLWKNQLFLGSLATQRLIRIEIENGRIVGEEEIFRGYGRVRDIHTGPDGMLYLALEQIGSASGRLVRLVPVSRETAARGDFGK